MHITFFIMLCIVLIAVQVLQLPFHLTEATIPRNPFLKTFLMVNAK